MWGKNWNNEKDERGCGGPVLRDPHAQAQKHQNRNNRMLPYTVNTKFRADVPMNTQPRNSPTGFGGHTPRKPFNSFNTPPRGPESPVNSFNMPSLGSSVRLNSFSGNLSPFPPTFNEIPSFPSAFADPNPTMQQMPIPPSPFSGGPPSNVVPSLSFPPPPIAPFSGNHGPNFQDQTNNQQFFAMSLNNSVIQSPSMAFGRETNIMNPSVPPPPPSFSVPDVPANNSVAVFTNDQQPPFAFPDNSPVPRFPRHGSSTSNRLLELAYGGAAGGESTADKRNTNSATPAHANSFSPASKFAERSLNRNTGQQNTWGRSDSASPGLLPNPFFQQGNINKTAINPSNRKPSNQGFPDWMRDDEDIDETTRSPFMGGAGKKKQNFDWKGSSFLKRLNSAPTNHNSNPIRAIETSPNANNVLHAKSCVKNTWTAKNGNSNANQNHKNIKQVPMAERTPLLPTPKLVPYPPPPLPKKALETVSRAPKSILKPQSSYNNFVREGDTPDDDNQVSVVPYDDEDDVEFVGEVVGNDSTKSSNDSGHDFFSEKIVQHFSKTLEGKPMETQLDEFLHYLVLSPNYLTSRVNILRSLHVMLSEVFKKCSLHPYGADFIGIGNSDDSVNIFVDLNGKHGAASSVEESNIKASALTKENIDDLMTIMQEDKRNKFFGQIVRRTNFNFYRRNLPVISFIHSDTKVRCNIRFDNYLLVQEAKVLQFICSLDTRLPPLLALLRYWSSVHKVLDTPEEDTKNRFATLLMLFFLAQKKIIPTMAHIQSLSIKREYFENMDISFCDDFSLVPPNENSALEDKAVFALSTLSLLKQFFMMFASAKFEEEVVSLWKAEFIPKENFGPDVEGKVLPPELRKRYRYAANGQLREKRIDCSSLLCIQDFQDLTENLSLAVAEYDVKKFQIECGIAQKKIDEIIMGSGNLMDLFVITEYADCNSTANVEVFLRKVEGNG